MMKVYFLLTLFITFYLNSYSQDSSLSKKIYDIKSCKIVYKYNIGFAKGEKTIIFDNWGNIEKENGVAYIDTLHPITKMFDSLFHKSDTTTKNKIPSTQHILAIQTHDIIYNIDLDKKIGSMRTRFHLEEFLGVTDSLEKIIGADTFLGKQCIIKEFGGQLRFWYWNKIVLKKVFVDSNGDKSVQEYAIEIDENYKIKPDEFEPPKDIIFQ